MPSTGAFRSGRLTGPTEERLLEGAAEQLAREMVAAVDDVQLCACSGLLSLGPGCLACLAQVTARPRTSLLTPSGGRRHRPCRGTGSVADAVAMKPRHPRSVRQRRSVVPQVRESQAIFMGPRSAATRHVTDIASPRWCWEHLGATGEGTLSRRSTRGHLRVAVRYTVVDQRISIRLDPVDSLGWSAVSADVCLEIGGSTPDGRQWVVRASGAAERPSKTGGPASRPAVACTRRADGT